MWRSTIQEKPKHRVSDEGDDTLAPHKAILPEAVVEVPRMRSPSSGRVLAPVGKEAPPQRVERQLAGLVIAPDYKQVLARGSIPPRRIVVDAAVAYIEAIHDGVAQRTAALDYSAAHQAAYRNTVKEWNRERPGLACGPHSSAALAELTSGLFAG
jgi:hypothetical protein